MENNLAPKSPTVSVVMSVYNGEKYLKEAIESVLNQTYADFEFIIINDGSTDNSLSIINYFSDSRIILINNEGNKGLIYSLNKGIEVSKGNFIARMDSDDICMLDRFHLQVKSFNDNPNAIIVGSDYYQLNGENQTYIKNINDSDYQKATLLFSTCFCHPTVMMKNIFKKENVFYNENYIHAEDYKLWTDLAFKGKFLNINKPLLKYRHHESQISNTKNDTQLRISKMIRADFLKKLNFSLSENQFLTLNIIGDNVFITTVELLLKIENCLLQLKKQNHKSSFFNQISFNSFLNKFWLDSCGNTNLGFKAYSIYSNSDLSKLISYSIKDRTKLLIKCLIRKFKN